MDFSKYVLSIPDFPKKGIIFRDVTPLLANPEAYEEVIIEWAEKLKDLGATKIVAAESRGFLFGTAVALTLALPFIPVRKKGKLPRETIGVEFELEYGTDMLFLHKDDIKPSDRVIVLDDVLATGGTAEAMCKLVEKSGAKVACCTFLIELAALAGAAKLKDKRLHSILKF